MFMKFDNYLDSWVSLSNSIRNEKLLNSLTKRNSHSNLQISKLKKKKGQSSEAFIKYNFMNSNIFNLNNYEKEFHLKTDKKYYTNQCLSSHQEHRINNIIHKKKDIKDLIRMEKEEEFQKRHTFSPIINNLTKEIRDINKFYQDQMQFQRKKVEKLSKLKAILKDSTQYSSRPNICDRSDKICYKNFNSSETAYERLYKNFLSRHQNQEQRSLFSSQISNNISTVYKSKKPTEKLQFSFKPNILNISRKKSSSYEKLYNDAFIMNNKSFSNINEENGKISQKPWHTLKKSEHYLLLRIKIDFKNACKKILKDSDVLNKKDLCHFNLDGILLFIRFINEIASKDDDVEFLFELLSEDKQIIKTEHLFLMIVSILKIKIPLMNENDSKREMKSKNIPRVISNLKRWNIKNIKW